MINFESKLKKGLQNHQKSIGPIEFSQVGDHHVAKPYKTNGKLMILRGPKRQKGQKCHQLPRRVWGL